MKKSKQPSKPKDLSRRDVLKRGAIAGALPFAIAIPTGTGSVSIPLERMRGLHAREAEYHRELQQKLAQIGGRPLPPGATHPPPPPPPRATWNTPWESSTPTTQAETTFSNRGGKEVSDDTQNRTYHDDTTTRYTTDG